MDPRINICYRDIEIAMSREETVTSSGYASKKERMKHMWSPPTTPDANENKEAKYASHEAEHEQRWEFYGPFIEFG